MISAENVVRRFGRTTAVDGMSLHVAAGERVALLGHNGAGKSTLMKLVAGQLPASAGTLRVAGFDPAAEPEKVRAAVGFVPEEPCLWDYLSAREMVHYVAEVRGDGDAEAALRLTELGEDADRFIREYSQGMRRKVAIACAIVAAPPVLVLDEALNGLDPPAVLRMAEELKARADAGAAVLVSTHVIDLVPRLADRVVVLKAGRVHAEARVADATAAELAELIRR